MRNILTASLFGLLATQAPALAAEAGLGVYNLGNTSFNAGIVPPAKTYVTLFTGYYSGTTQSTAMFGGLPVDPGAELDFFQTGVNLLFVPEQPILGGTLGLSALVGVAHTDFAGSIYDGMISSQTDGWGTMDSWIKAQLGWQEGTFFHAAYISAALPTGTYDTGFFPATGLNRPAIDAGWGFTWIEPQTMIQLNGQLGFTYNFENAATDYQTGTEMHFEWAVGKDFGNGLTAGIVGYDYRQLTGDSGAGAVLGDMKGSVDAVGVGASYLTPMGQFSFRHYQEFNAVNRFEGSTTLATWSLAF